jgi:hypothetical protein
VRRFRKQWGRERHGAVTAVGCCSSSRSPKDEGADNAAPAGCCSSNDGVPKNATPCGEEDDDSASDPPSSEGEGENYDVIVASGIGRRRPQGVGGLGGGATRQESPLLARMASAAVHPTGLAAKGMIAGALAAADISGASDWSRGGVDDCGDVVGGGRRRGASAWRVVGGSSLHNTVEVFTNKNSRLR